MKSLSWVVNVRDKCNEMKEEVKGKDASSKNYQQCLLVKLLADRIEYYVQQWIETFGEESWWNSTEEVWKELLSVLNSGLQLITCSASAEKDSPALLVFFSVGLKGELSEIIDDARIYVQMINRFILHSLSLSFHKQQSIVEKLSFDVELDCSNLLFYLEMANQQDKNTLINGLEAQPTTGGWSSWFPKSSRGPMSSLSLLFKPTENFITENDLSKRKDLGKGSYGKVQSAEWLKILVAVKIFDNEKHLEDELEVFKELLCFDSPHIVRMVGHSSKELVLELMDMDMNKHITEQWNRLPLIQSLDLILQIAKAMRHLHSHNVVHRDLKPANVLLKSRHGRSPLIKLSDFGVSKHHFETATSNNTHMRGTKKYWAPEMEKDTVPYSRKVDVYSFGLMCLEILTGEIRKEEEELVLPIDIPKNLGELIKTCIKVNAAERPSFDDICDSLWLVKEEILTKVIDTEAIELKLTIGPQRMSLIRNIHPNKIIPTVTGKRAIYVLSFESVRDEGCSICHLPIDNLVDILLDGGWFPLTASGTLEFWNSSTTTQLLFIGIYTQLKFLKDQGKKFNLYLSIGGWNRSECFSAVFSTETTRNTFVNSVLGLLKKYPIFNGLVIDWKYVSEHDVDNLVLTIEALRKELPVGSFMIALTSASSAARQWPIERAIHLVDQIHVDLHPANSAFAFHQSALYPSSSSEHNIDEDVMRMYISHKAPASKIFIMGTLKPIEYRGTKGLGTLAERSYWVTTYKDRPTEEKFDEEAKAAYAHDPHKKVLYSYDNVRSMVEKAKYIKKKNLGGILVKSAHFDFPSNHMAKALHDNLTHA